MKRLLPAIILVLAAVAIVTAVELPGYKGPVNDLAGVLNRSEVQALETKVLGYRSQTGSEIAVLIVPTLGSRALEDYAIDVFKAWGIGQKDKNNGVLFLLAIEEKKARVEVGYGLEGDLTDLECGRLVNKNSPMAESFRQGDFAGGIENVVDGIVVAIGGEYNPPKPKTNAKKALPAVVIPLLIGMGLVMSLIRRTKSGSKWFRGGGFGGPFIGGMGGFGGFGGGSSGGGGGFSFGGGSSGGGGASGGW